MSLPTAIIASLNRNRRQAAGRAPYSAGIADHKPIPGPISGPISGPIPRF